MTFRKWFRGQHKGRRLRQPAEVTRHHRTLRESSRLPNFLFSSMLGKGGKRKAGNIRDATARPTGHNYAGCKNARGTARSSCLASTSSCTANPRLQVDPCVDTLVAAATGGKHLGTNPEYCPNHPTQRPSPQKRPASWPAHPVSPGGQSKTLGSKARRRPPRAW